VALFLEQEREEVDLEKQVAELVQLLFRITGQNGVGNLVGLLERMRNDRGRGLLAIPRTLTAQALGETL
jgi:hypothetical protein